MAAGESRNPGHRFRNYFRHRQVVRVCRLAVLEMSIGILGDAPLVRALRIERALPKSGHRFPVNQLFDLFIINNLYLLHFMRSAETVKKVQEGNA